MAYTAFYLQDGYVEPKLSFRQKCDVLSEFYTEVTPYEFYSDLFPPATIESASDMSINKPNPIVGLTRTDGDRTYVSNVIMFNSYSVLNEVYQNKFAVCSMCTYFGKKRTAKNAFTCNGICIDLDAVGQKELYNFLNRMGNDFNQFPVPTYINNSGHGIHVIYIFENPVPLYPNNIKLLQDLKKGLTTLLWWGGETSGIDGKHRQYQGIYQGFRMPGSHTKLAKEAKKTKYIVRSWKVGRKVNLDYLNSFLFENDKVSLEIDWADPYETEGHTPLGLARTLWPEWYERRVIKKLPKGHYLQHRGLYDWWLNILQTSPEVREGNRYYCICVLFSMGLKAGVDKKFIYADACDLIPYLNALTKTDEFTIEDVNAASKCYKDEFFRLSNKGIKSRTNIDPYDYCTPIRRNGRTQEAHLKRARMEKALKIEETADEIKKAYFRGGRPAHSGEKKNVVQEWKKMHPDGTITECARDNKLSRSTVYKWWN